MAAIQNAGPVAPVELLDHLLEAMPDAAIVSDAEGVVLAANVQALQLFGYAPDALIGLGVDSLVPGSLRARHARRHQAYAQRPSPRHMGGRRILEGERSDGTRLALEIGLMPLGTTRGLLVLCIFRDVGERERAYEESRRAQEELRAVIEASPTAIVATDLDDRVTLWNAAAEHMFGWKASEVLGHEVPNVPEDERELYAHCRARALAGERETSFEASRHRKDGRRLDVSLSWAPLRGRDGSTCGIVSAIVDVGERRRAEQALREQEERLREAQQIAAIGTLAGGLAHDFNNVLLAIRGHCELLLDTAALDEDAARRVRAIAATAEHGGVLTSRLVALARSRLPEDQLIDLRDVVRDMEPLLRRVLPEHTRLRLRLSRAPLPMLLDALQIQQVLLNLVANARDAMPGGGEILIALGFERDVAERRRGPRRHVRLAVSDSGCGMDDVTLARAFEPFYSTKGGKGTGLGLPTVLTIVERLGGEVGIESSPGHGTTVSILLPAQSAPASAPSSPASDRGRTGSFSSTGTQQAGRRATAA